MADAFQKNVAALKAAGLDVVVDLFRTDQGQGTRMRVALMDQPATRGERITLVMGVYSVTFARLMASSVEVVTRFAEKGSLSVSNSPQPRVFGAVPGRIKERLPEVHDPVRLLRIHEALLARRYGALPAEPLQYQADPARFLSDSMVREMTQQVDTGYLRLDRRASVYRPTWKGAFLMSWKLVSPVREIREWRRRRHARALLRELGFDADDLSVAGGGEQRRAAPLRWNWIALVAVVVLLLVRPRWPDPGISPRRESGPLPIPGDFTVPDDFPGAVKALERLAGAVATPLLTLDSLGGSTRTAGVALPVAASRAPALVAAVQDRFLAKGFYLFRVAQHFGIHDLPDTLALYPSGERYAILRVVGTNGANYGIGPDSIVTWLTTLDRDHPFVLTGIGFDWLDGRFTTPIADPDALARRFNAFCPDIVEQGTGSVAALARELRRSAQFYCWWD